MRVRMSRRGLTPKMASSSSIVPTSLFSRFFTVAFILSSRRLFRFLLGSRFGSFFALLVGFRLLRHFVLLVLDAVAHQHIRALAARNDALDHQNALLDIDRDHFE